MAVRNDFFYNLILNYSVSKTKDWLNSKNKDELKKIIKNNNDLVKLLKPHLTGDNLKRIPPTIRNSLVLNIPQVKEKFIKDYLNSLQKNKSYGMLISEHEGNLRENAHRLLNLIVIELKELDN